jgi:Flp pilus assembly protein TadG
VKNLVRRRRARNHAKGAALVEFALVALMFLSIVFVSFNFFFWTFAKAALHHAVREGSRYAITGKTTGGSQDASIRQVVRDNAFGLLTAANSIAVDYYTPDGTSTTSNAAGNVVVVSVLNYTPASIAPLFGIRVPGGMTVRAVDKVEPYPGASPTR